MLKSLFLGHLKIMWVGATNFVLHLHQWAYEIVSAIDYLYKKKCLLNPINY